MSTARTRYQVQVVTFNILCSSLSKASYFCSCDQEACDPEKRLCLLVKILQRYTLSDSVICLQELSRTWHAQLLPILRRLGYTVVFSSYGHHGDDYMGVAIAFKDEVYCLLDMSDKCIAHGATWYQTPTQDTMIVGVSNRCSWINSDCSYILRDIYRDRCYGNNSQYPFDGSDILDRRNTLLMLRLGIVDKERGGILQSFVVGTCHLPCTYKHPMVTMLYAAEVGKQFHAFKGNYAGILAGDFNMKPTDNAYKILTEGGVQEDLQREILQEFPMVKRVDIGSPLVFESAYYVKCKKEPAFTCHAVIKRKDGKCTRFHGTLDYVFVTPGVIVESACVSPDISPNKLGESLPNHYHPSDHVAIVARVTI